MSADNLGISENAVDMGFCGAQSGQQPKATERVGAARTGTEAPGVKEIADQARAGDAVAEDVLVTAFTHLADALTPWIERFGVTRTVLGGSIAGAFDLVRSAFDFEVSATQDTERSGLIGAAAHYVRS